MLFFLGCRVVSGTCLKTDNLTSIAACKTEDACTFGCDYATGRPFPFQLYVCFDCKLYLPCSVFRHACPVANHGRSRLNDWRFLLGHVTTLACRLSCNEIHSASLVLKPKANLRRESNDRAQCADARGRFFGPLIKEYVFFF